MDGIPWGSLLNDASVVVVIVLMGFFVISGKLRPDRNVQEIREDREIRVNEIRTEADQWREAYFKSEEARRELQDSVEALLELARTSDAVLKAIQGGRGGSDA